MNLYGFITILYIIYEFSLQNFHANNEINLDFRVSNIFCYSAAEHVQKQTDILTL